MDYETGSGMSRLRYDRLLNGSRVGFTFHF